MAEDKKTIFIGTISYLLSHRSYRDFITSGLNINQLPMLSDAISKIQADLENIDPVELQHKGGDIAHSELAPRDLSPASTVEPFQFSIQDFFIQSVSFENGSVYAKFQIGAFLMFAAYQGLADYKDVKEGFAELREDIITLVNAAFDVDGAGSVEGELPEDDAEIRYYFVQPRRIEEEVLRRRLPPRRRFPPEDAPTPRRRPLPRK